MDVDWVGSEKNDSRPTLSIPGKHHAITKGVVVVAFVLTVLVVVLAVLCWLQFFF